MSSLPLVKTLRDMADQDFERTFINYQRHVTNEVFQVAHERTFVSLAALAAAQRRTPSC